MGIITALGAEEMQLKNEDCLRLHTLFKLIWLVWMLKVANNLCWVTDTPIKRPSNQLHTFCLSIQSTNRPTVNKGGKWLKCRSHYDARPYVFCSVLFYSTDLLFITLKSCPKKNWLTRLQITLSQSPANCRVRWIWNWMYGSVLALKSCYTYEQWWQTSMK